MSVEKNNHVTPKCKVCTIGDMLSKDWCNLKCELRSVIKKKNISEELDMSLNVNSNKFKKIIMER